MSQPVTLCLMRSQVETLQGLAAAAYPQECCGLLVGEGNAEITVVEVISAPNMAEEPRKGFAIDPQLQFDTLRATRDTLDRVEGRRVVGHYHSHPNGRATPSAHDFAMAHDPDAVWLILAVSGEGPPQLRAFRRPADQQDFVEIPMRIQP